MSPRFADDVILDGVRGRESNLPFGILAGIVAAAIGAGIWMAVAITTGLQVGYVAIAIGAMVGLAMRVVGNGRSMIFGIVGALLTLGGCLGGEILTQVQRASSEQSDFYHTLVTTNIPLLVTNIFQQADTMMYVIYAIGIFEGYKLSIRK